MSDINLPQLEDNAHLPAKMTSTAVTMNHIWFAFRHWLTC